MKTRKYSFWVLLLTLSASSCSDDDLSPIITFDSAIKGAYVRLIEESPREFDLQATSTTQYEYTVEFVDFEKGARVDQYEIYASYVDKNPDNGDASAGPVSIKSFDASDFISNERGYLGLTVVLTLEELSSTLGITVADIQALDQFKIDSRITTKDGKTFMASNTSATVNGSAFQGHFRFALLATCPLLDDMFVGQYNFINLWDYGTFPGPLEKQIVTLKTVRASSTKREFIVSYLDALGGFDVPITIEFLCDSVITLTVDTGIGCGDNIIFLPGNARPVDISDLNAVILFELIENTGDCEAGVNAYLIQLKPI